MQSTNSNPELSAGDTITFSYTTVGSMSFTVTVPDDGGGVGSVNGLSTAFDALGIGNLTAVNLDGKFTPYFDPHQTSEFLFEEHYYYSVEDLG